MGGEDGLLHTGFLQSKIKASDETGIEDRADNEGQCTGVSTYCRHWRFLVESGSSVQWLTEKNGGGLGERAENCFRKVLLSCR